MARLRQVLADDRGSVTAEFAIALPAAMLVLGVAIGAIVLAAERVSLTSSAAEIARLEARGDTAAAQSQILRLPAKVSISRARHELLHCVQLRAAPRPGVLQGLTVEAQSCAAVSQGAAIAGTGTGSDETL